MEISEVFQLIGSYGFPIVMCVLLLWYVDKQQKLHKEEIDKMNESLNANTKAIELLTAKLGGKNE